jgi:hexosaminidase
MALIPKTGFRLTSAWTPAGDGVEALYVLTLTNNSGAAASGFKLCITGPARIDPNAAIEGAVLSKRLSNYSELSPEDGFILASGASWKIKVRGLSYPLRHWSDGATAAYLAFDDGSSVQVDPSPTLHTANNKPLLKGTARLEMSAGPGASVSIVPWPNQISVAALRPVPGGLWISATSQAAASAAKAFEELSDRLFPVEGLVREASQGGIAVSCADDKSLASEAYRLDFLTDQITLHASSHPGFLYGLITLAQMLRGARLFPDIYGFPAEGHITDRPAMSWRGCHLDAARQFYPAAEVSQLLAIMAWNKLNRFHWHLSDDEAWRVEINAYPALTQIGAWRGHGLPIPPLLGSGAQTYGGFYTKVAVRGLVELAASFGIEVVPEVDIPGHCFAMLQSMPELRDPKESGEYQSVQGFPNNCLNPAREETYQALETIFDEMIDLFPSKLFHIGADEVPLGAWSGSPQALQMLEAENGISVADAHAKRSNVVSNLHGADEIEGTGAAILQAKFLARVQSFLAARGCVTGGWEEAAHGNVIDKGKSYLVGWRNVEGSRRLAAEGYDIVVSPGQAYYLDMSQSVDFTEPGAGWAGWSGPKETYDFEPDKGWTEIERTRLLGVQACIWSEPMTDRAVFDRLVFPRLSAIAETAWTEAARKSWPRFASASRLMPNLYGHWET